MKAERRHLKLREKAQCQCSILGIIHKKKVYRMNGNFKWGKTLKTRVFVGNHWTYSAQLEGGWKSRSIDEEKKGRLCILIGILKRQMLKKGEYLCTSDSGLMRKEART